jgi:putative hemolysin
MPVQPRTTPSAAAAIVAARPAAHVEREVAALPADQLLVDGDDEVVYIADAEQIPAALHEIGRLREITFRAVGEGTGRAVDLDEFDARYRHLFIWSRARREIDGAYRIGATDDCLARAGLGGLSTSTLFEFKPRLFDMMGPALEMGRSFIRPEQQRSYGGLMLLWKGIGRYVVREPRYATLFGPVSISADYQSASQQLIVAFLEQNRYVHEWSRWVRPRVPCRRGAARELRSGLAALRDLDDVSAFIAEIEADQKGVPILLKQYLRLGGRLLGFNVDPEFSSVLDVLIMVDLRRTEPKILARYMGREGAESFLRGHAGQARASGA